MIRSRFARTVLLIAGLAIASSCSSTEPLPLLKPSIAAGHLGAIAASDGIQVYNGTDSPDPYYLFAIERVTSTYTDWVPCTGGPACPSIMPGERRTIPWSSVAGYAASKNEYIVSLWRVTRSADGSVAVSDMHNILVTR